MEVFKLNIHSVVDVITNSSTTIYTYQDGCEEPAKELINEMLKLAGETDKKAEDIFYIGVFVDNDCYFEQGRDGDDDDENDYEDDEDDEDEVDSDGEVKDYLELLNEDQPLTKFVNVVGDWRTDEYKESKEAQRKWFEKLQIAIMKGEVKKPSWMLRAEDENGNGYNPSSYLLLVPRDEKYAEFGRKISALLSGVSADGGYDG